MNEAGDNEAFAGLSILVVEDEVAIAMLLEDGGCTNVTLVPSVEAALASIGRRALAQLRDHPHMTFSCLTRGAEPFRRAIRLR